MLDRSPRHGSRGQALPFVALAIVSLLGLSALVVDAGYWGFEQRMEQAAADSGAIAGANELPFVTPSSPPNQIKVLAQRDAQYNGFTDGVNKTSVVVNSPPVTGNYAGNANAVEVIVSKVQTGSLSGIFHATAPKVSARAVALRGTATRDCLYGLDTSGTAISFNGSTVNMPQCGIISNSNFLANGSTITATSIGYVGYNENIYGDTYPLGKPLKASPAADPCPSLAGCAYLTAHPPTSLACVQDPQGGYSNYNYNDSPGLTLRPGRYCGGVNINSGQYAVTFAPGVYDFQYGMNDNGVPELDGNGVSFYVEHNSININGNPKMNLVAPATGNTLGVLFYYPPTNSGGFTLNSGSTGPSGALAGMIYVPDGTVIVNGTITTWALVAAKDIILNSSSNINVQSASFPGSTTRPSALVE